MKSILPFFFACLLLMACGKSDDKIENEINARISAGNPTVRATVKDGVATLTGTCPDESCRNTAESAAKGIDGVKQVVNEIVVSAPPAPAPQVTISTDDSLKTAVNGVLKNYKDVKADVSEGVVTLTGSIKRSQLQELMQDVTATNPKKIENKLEIKTK
jgi:osmotically-inducible protein OsmY